jgi:tetratricopeptide (TPR) repeat protein
MGIAFAQSAKELNDQAQYYYGQGKYQQAITLLLESIRMEPRADSYYGLGLCYVGTGELTKAIPAFWTAARADKYYIKGLYQIASIYMRSEYGHFDIDAAIDVLLMVLNIDPNHAEAQFKLGEMYFLKGSIGVNTTQEKMQIYQKKAETALLRAIALDPQNADAHSYLGQLYGTWGKHTLAIDQFQNAVKLDPQHSEAWLYLGIDYFRLGMLDNSINALENAEKCQNDNIRQAVTDMLRKVRTAKAGKN